MIAQPVYEAARQLVTLPPQLQAAVLDELTDQEVKLTFEALKYDWPLWRREKQRPPPGTWRWLLFSCGRGFGKTRTATELLRACAEKGEDSYVSLTAATSVTLKRVLLYGPAGIFTISPPWFRPALHSVDEMLVWPKHPTTGVRMICYLMSGEDPDRLRGNEVSKAFLDELTTWNRPEEGWRNIDLTLRHGPDPRGFICVTPKREGAGVAFSKDLLYGKRGIDGKRRQRDDMVIVHGSTVENVDITESTLRRWEAAYRGTADEITELEGQLPKEALNALWTLDTIDKFRLSAIPPGVAIERVITSLDPTRSKTGSGDLCGNITLAGGSDGHAYVFADDSGRASPDVWINRAVAVYKQWRCDSGIYEQNRLGEDNATLLQSRAREHRQSWKPITARGTKKQRAEPISAEYRAGRVHHVGEFPELEEEMTGWDPDEKSESPNRIDALVHGVKELLLSDAATRPPLIAR